MRKPSKFRRLPYFTLALWAFTIVATIYVIRSLSHCERLTFGRFGFFLDCGVTGLAAYTDDPRNRPPREHWRHAPTWYWRWWSWGHTDNTSFSAMVSAWPVPIVTGLASMALTSRWWLRIRSTRCVKCGYDLRNLLPEDPCPECGLQGTPR